MSSESNSRFLVSSGQSVEDEAGERRGPVHVIFVVGFAFPFGSAPAQRVHAYARGLVERGNHVTILCLRAVLAEDLSGRKVARRGTVDGIEYVWTPGRAERARSFLARRFLELRGALAGLAEIGTGSRRRPVDAIATYLVPVWVDLLYKAVCLVWRIPVVSEKNEFPFPERTLLLNRVRARVEEAVTWLCYNGIIVISSELEAYFGRVSAAGTKLLRIPILVDFTRFGPVERDRSGEVRVAYCGDPYGRKDGVPILLEAFSRIAPDFPQVTLWIIGDSWLRGVLDGLKEKAAGLGIAERVVFTGRVPAGDVPRLLGEADILVLARPTSLQASGGFPTKLGEYLASGRPVVTTRVGELADWLEDGRDVFFCEPDSVEAFADRLKDVLMLRDLGREVGGRGRKRALECFDYRVHAPRLESFLGSFGRRN